MSIIPLLLLVLYISTAHSWLCNRALYGMQRQQSSNVVMKLLKEQTIVEIIELRKHYKSLTEKVITDDEKGTQKENVEKIELILRSADSLHKIEEDLQMFEDAIENPKKDPSTKKAASELKKEYLIIRRNIENELNHIFSDDDDDDDTTPVDTSKPLMQEDSS